MNLKINKCDNRYQINGTLNKLSLKIFNDYFLHVFDKLDHILIDLEQLESIDKYGVMAITALYNESVVKSKQLSIIGLGCKHLYYHFKTQENIK